MPQSCDQSLPAAEVAEFRTQAPSGLVVIVDDQGTGRRILSQIIKGIGPSVEAAPFAEAAAAMEFMREHSVDLIITDYVMPGMDGLALIKRVRADPRHADVPIIVVTVLEDRDIRYRALDAGATDFLNRPVDEHECRARCRNLLTLRCQQLALRVRAQRLEQSERRFRTMADELPLMIWLLDAATGARFVNRTCWRYFGLPGPDLDDLQWRALLHPDDRDGCVAAYQSACDARRPFHGECRVRRGDGAWRWLEVYARPYDLPGGDFGGIVGAGVDITERKQAEQGLKDSHVALEERGRQLASLASELTLTEQRERLRLAKVLHDDLQQLLVGASFGIDRARRGLDREQADSRILQALGHADEGLNQAIGLSRNLVADLTPLVLHEAGMVDALEWLAGRMRERFGLDVQLDLDPGGPTLGGDIRSLMFDAVREALLNAAKHAQCASAMVSMRLEGDAAVVLSIEDRGVGFDVRRLRPRRGTAGGFGLFLMRERLEAIGGEVRVDSASGHGTKVVFRLPLAARGDPSGQAHADAERRPE